MPDNNNCWKNGSQVSDPTAGEAVQKVDKERTEEEIQFYALLKVFWSICDIAGFDAVGRVSVRHRKSGRLFT